MNFPDHFENKSGNTLQSVTETYHQLAHSMCFMKALLMLNIVKMVPLWHHRAGTSTTQIDILVMFQALNGTCAPNTTPIGLPEVMK